MAIYKEIISWSANKPMFIRDAIRRLLENSSLTDTDIDELFQILKKQVGFSGIDIDAIPASDTHIPGTSNQTSSVAKLVSIANPINICALYKEAKLTFSKDGLTLVYGNNGSGKSSYSRLLKKLCWSRDKNVVLKKNVYTGDMKNQTVELLFDCDGTEIPFSWHEGINVHPSLNSVYVFDSNCASIYINNENPSEYKPIGIDILDRLIPLCKKLDSKFDNEISLLTTVKPPLDSKYGNTDIYRWYSTIQNTNIEAVNTKLNFDSTQKERILEITKQLQLTNPTELNLSLLQKKARYLTFAKEIQNIEKILSEESINAFIAIKTDYIIKKDAYEIAKNNLEGNDPLNGVGTESWRQLWSAAKQFAITEIHPESSEYPDLS